MKRKDRVKLKETRMGTRKNPSNWSYCNETSYLFMYVALIFFLLKTSLASLS